MPKITSSQSPTRDIRAVLHYVPQFIGCVFFIELDWAELPQPAKAELMMDLRALQTIGVKLAITVEETEVTDLIEWGVELELKMAQPCLSLTSDVHLANDITTRGQACLIERGAQPTLSDQAITIAHQLNAAKLIVLTKNDTPAYDRNAVRAIPLSKAHTLKQSDSPTIPRAVFACEQGIDRVHILDARDPGVLLDELFSNEGVGTMIHKDSYQEIRHLREEDIPELLGMIGRSVRNSNLVPRNYEEIQHKLADYHVICIDGHVVGSIALHPYAQETEAELACLYVKHSHESRGYGATLVQYAIETATAAGYTRIFALTNQAKAFFLKLGFTLTNTLPESRRQQLDESGRNSLILEKHLS